MTGLFGLCIGSFLNVVIYRVPLGMSVAKPASHCPRCQAPIHWYDNIPVLSYILLGGKCRHCRAPISFRYTAVEIANTVMWLVCMWRFWSVDPWYALLTLPVCSVLICVFFIDLEHMLILDRFQILLGVAAVAAVLLDPSAVGGDWLSHVIGGIAGFGVLWLIAVAGEKMLGREALGGGDIKFCAVMGLFLGWQKLLLVMLLSSVVASVVLLLLKQRRHEESREYPFGPFLAAGFWIVLVLGDTVLRWYMSLLL